MSEDSRSAPAAFPPDVVYNGLLPWPADEYLATLTEIHELLRKPKDD